MKIPFSPFCKIISGVLLIAILAVSLPLASFAQSEERGETALKRVTRTFVNETDELIHITICDEEIVCTNGHPFYSPVKGWTAACQLRAGDILVTVNGELVIVEKIQHELLEDPIFVYNFEVEDFHTYHVGADSVLVHNRCSGSYEINTNDGRVYVGKGSESRMMRSIKRLRNQGYSISDGNWHWDWAGSDKVGFIDEYMKMAKYDFDFGGKLINKIMSPGFKLFESMF